jgi:uncharacterized membrane protein YqaE (UPF0057 family)
VDVVRVLLAILLPPLGVFLQVGLGGHFWLNILLTLLGYVPGLVHAVWIIVTRPRKQLRHPGAALAWLACGGLLGASAGVAAAAAPCSDPFASGYASALAEREGAHADLVLGAREGVLYLDADLASPAVRVRVEEALVGARCIRRLEWSSAERSGAAVEGEPSDRWETGESEFPPPPVPVQRSSVVY